MLPQDRDSGNVLEVCCCRNYDLPGSCREVSVPPYNRASDPATLQRMSKDLIFIQCFKKVGTDLSEIAYVKKRWTTDLSEIAYVKKRWTFALTYIIKREPSNTPNNLFEHSQEKITKKRLINKYKDKKKSNPIKVRVKHKAKSHMELQIPTLIQEIT